MKTYTAATVDPVEVCDELMNGAGAVKVKGLFSDADINEARQIIMEYSDADAVKVTHFQGAAAEEGKINLQRRVWNLLAKGDVFSRMAEEPTIMKILSRFLGSEFIMGSIAANRILPGGPGQEPHVDFPYWDFHKPDSHPMGVERILPDERADLGHSGPVYRGKRRDGLYARHAERPAVSDARGTEGVLQ